MRNSSIVVVCMTALFLSCSPRDFLTRRLTADLIAASNTFRTPQQFQLRTGVIANKDYLSPDLLALQHRGWISSATAPCTPALAPPPCWDVTLTPDGVETFQSLIPPGDAGKQSFTIPIEKRELVAINGIASQGNVADVDFTWKWTPLNEVGAALHHHSVEVQYHSTTAFRRYDDGWRLVESAHPGQPLDEALRDAQPAQ